MLCNGTTEQIQYKGVFHMSRTLGTVARGVRTPIFREGDNVVEGVVSSVLTALKENGIQPHDKDVAAVTESVVARCQGNYATVEQIAADVKAKTGGKTVGVTFPILSRNRFSLLLSGIAAGVEKVVLMLSYPSDEVGNHLVSLDQLDEAGIDPWHDVLDLEQFRAAFGKVIEGMDVADTIVNADRDRMDKPKQEQRMKSVTVETFGVDYPAPAKC